MWSASLWVSARWVRPGFADPAVGKTAVEDTNKFWVFQIRKFLSSSDLLGLWPNGIDPVGWLTSKKLPLLISETGCNTTSAISESVFEELQQS